MEWLKKLSKAIDYIEDNLTGNISYEEAARIACCSTYYFQRMFSYVAGIPLSEYIRRRRMTVAAFDLQTSDAKVMDVGLKYGYESPTSFNRAFQNVHGVPPTAARKSGTSLQAYPRISFSIKVTGGESMRYRIETKDAIRIVGVRVPLQENQEENFQIVPKFWDKILEGNLYSEVCKLANQDPQGILGVTAYKSPKEIYYYIAVATDKPVPEGMMEFNIPAATWVIFAVMGIFKNPFKQFSNDFLQNGFLFLDMNMLSYQM